MEPTYICPDCGVGMSDVPGTCGDCGAELVAIDDMKDDLSTYSSNDLNDTDDEDLDEEGEEDELGGLSPDEDY